MTDKQLILSPTEVLRKIRRIALEILERNFNEKVIYLCGINDRGNRVAQMIGNELKSLNHPTEIKMCHLTINPDSLMEATIKLEGPESQFKNQGIVLVDDVANTGKTLQFAIRPFLKLSPKKIQLAVLVNRMHKAYPVRADFVGFSLSTTMKEHVEVVFKPKEKVSVFLT